MRTTWVRAGSCSRLGDVIAALQACGALALASPVPGQLAALCAHLNLSGGHCSYETYASTNVSDILARNNFDGAETVDLFPAHTLSRSAGPARGRVYHRDCPKVWRSAGLNHTSAGCHGSASGNRSSNPACYRHTTTPGRCSARTF